MCGICGVWEYGASRGNVQRELLISMRDVMTHRGPDDAGDLIFDQARGGFGFRRLAIIDLSAAGHQPMHGCTDRVWLVFNGEIYNHASLREGLEKRGHIYASRTDSETILHLYEDRGLDFVQDIEGDYAIAMWDADREQWVLARDRAGVKPLYFYHRNGLFIFASEIKAILQHSAVTPEMNEEALYHYLTFVTTPAPQTLFRGIQKLPAGHMLTINRHGEVCISQYWDALPLASPGLTESEHQANILKLLRDSIKKRMMADVPFGGYDCFRTYLQIEDRFWRTASRAPAFARRAAAALAQPLIARTVKKRMAGELMRRLGAGESLFWGGAVVFDETMKSRVLSTEMRAQYNGLSTYNVVREYQDTIAAACPDADAAARMTYLELKLRLPELLLMRVDKITMATSVEARVPFLDHHLIEYAMSLPRDLKVKGRTGKHILNGALEPALPADVLYQPKRGFGAPVREWFRGVEGDELIHRVMNSRLRQRNFFDYGFIERLANEHARQQRDWSANLWCLLNLSLWYEHWIAGKD